MFKICSGALGPYFVHFGPFQENIGAQDKKEIWTHFIIANLLWNFSSCQQGCDHFYKNGSSLSNRLTTMKTLVVARRRDLLLLGGLIFSPCHD